MKTKEREFDYFVASWCGTSVHHDKGKTIKEEQSDILMEYAEKAREKGLSETAERIEDMNLYSEGYAEPGYTNPESGIIILGNWNSLDKEKGSEELMEALGKELEDNGADCDWEDEWISCTGCYKLVRTVPTSYDWTSYFFISDDGEVTCEDCAKEYPEETIEHYLNDHSRGITFEFDLTKYGFKRYNEDEYQNGFHPGQNDNPADIVKEIQAKGGLDYIFMVDGKGQFDINFSVWVREEDYEED